MYGVIYMLQFPYPNDPKMQSLELFDTFDEAKDRTEELADVFIEEYGEEYIEHATVRRPVAIMSNGETIGYAFIQKVEQQ